MHRIWLNKTSLVLCGIYLSTAALFFVLMHLSNDVKGAYIWGQLAGAPALALLTWTGTIDFAMNQFPWLNTYRRSNLPSKFALRSKMSRSEKIRK
jgi:hypothetical protein